MSRREMETIQSAAADLKAAAMKLAAVQAISLRYSARRCSDVLALVHMALDSCALDSAVEICGQIAQDRREIAEAVRFAEKTR